MSSVRIFMLMHMILIGIWMESNAQVQAEMVSSTTTETELNEILNDHKYGGHKSLLGNIVPGQVSVNGQGYFGYIEIRATDNKGHCTWRLVLEPYEAATKDYIVPKIYNRQLSCEYYTDDSILAFGIGHWRAELIKYFSDRLTLSNKNNPQPTNVLFRKDKKGIDSVIVTMGEWTFKKNPALPSKPTFKKLDKQ